MQHIEVHKVQKQNVCGTLTVEAAMVLPLFIFAVLILLGFFYVLQTEVEVTKAMQMTARRMAVASAFESMQKDVKNEKWKQLIEKSKGTVSVASAKTMIMGYLQNSPCWTDVMVHGAAGVRISDSEFDGDFIDLKARYQVKMPISFWGFSRLPVSVRVRARKWTGYHEEPDGNSESGWVYITRSGNAYHFTTACRYLDLSIRSVGYSVVKELRNKDGGRYYRCGCCNGQPEHVYITDYGTEYHGSRSCSHLKRTIYRVKIDRVGGRHECAACGQQKKK